mgnify:CR=1 FL=1
MKTAQEFRERILGLRPEEEGPSEYGSRVMPVLELYKRLEEFDERKAFQDALELLLASKIQEERAFAVDVCLGFFVFRDAI